MDRQEWLAWRKKGIGASDAPIIMGVSPWKTPYELYEEKTSPEIKESESNWATTRGNNLEPIVRAKYELINDIDLPATNLTHYQIEWLRASMDGYNSKEKHGIEIKCPGLADHQKALKNRVPEKYFPQIQHQFLVSGAKTIDYVSYYVEKEAKDSDGHMAIVTCTPDYEYIEKLFEAEKRFWMHVTEKKAPEMCDRDWKTIRNKDLSNVLKTYFNIQSQLKKLTIVEKDLKKQIEEMVKDKHPRLLVGSAKLQLVERAGSVDYKKIPELKGIDLEPYRKASSKYWKISDTTKDKQ